MEARWFGSELPVGADVVARMVGAGPVSALLPSLRCRTPVRFEPDGVELAGGGPRGSRATARGCTSGPSRVWPARCDRWTSMAPERVQAQPSELRARAGCPRRVRGRDCPSGSKARLRLRGGVAVSGKCLPPGSNRRCATFIATRTSPTSSLRCAHAAMNQRSSGAGEGSARVVRCGVGPPTLLHGVLPAQSMWITSRPT